MFAGLYFSYIFFVLSRPDCIGFAVYWPVLFIYIYIFCAVQARLLFTGLCLFIFFLAAQPRLYRFWCLLACAFHIYIFWAVQPRIV